MVSFSPNGIKTGWSMTTIMDDSLTPELFESFVQTASPGKRIVYFTGFLARWREDMQLRKRSSSPAEINMLQVAYLALKHGTAKNHPIWAISEHHERSPAQLDRGTGMGHLFQRRRGPGRYMYIFEKA